MRRWTMLLAVSTFALSVVVACGDDAAVHDGSAAATQDLVAGDDVAEVTDPTAVPLESTTPDSGAEPLVLVTMGHSLLFSPSPGVQGIYRGMLEEHFGVEVALRDHTRGGQRTDDFLERLRDDASLRLDLAEADVVLMLIPNGEWADTGYRAMSSTDQGFVGCGGEDGLQCFRETIRQYEAMVDQIFVELMDLVDPSDALVRITDFYVFTPGNADQAVIERLGPLWHEAQRHVAEVAARYGLAVAPVYDDFMGPAGVEQPEVAGLVSGDGIHPTAAGAQRMAQLLGQLGYEPAR